METGAVVFAFIWGIRKEIVKDLPGGKQSSLSEKNVRVHTLTENTHKVRCCNHKETA